MFKNVTPDPLSRIPLYLECFLLDNRIGEGTGFIVYWNGEHYLITNWHVVTGRSAETGEPLDKKNSTADPDTLIVWHHTHSNDTWLQIKYQIRDDDNEPLWFEHPTGRKVDVIAFPISKNDQIKIYELDLKLQKSDLILCPSETVSIIGFPFGQSSNGHYPIWKTGHIASDIELNYDNQPIFLIDSTTRPGMSGSPVIAVRKYMYQHSGGLSMGSTSCIEKFLGIYSGRTIEKYESTIISCNCGQKQLNIPISSEIGRVWKPTVIEEILKSNIG
jgi:hypothetical protein